VVEDEQRTAALPRKRLSEHGYKVGVVTGGQTRFRVPDSVTDRPSGFDAGADDYLARPFSLDQLLHRIQGLTRRATEDEGASHLQVADLRLDLAKLRAWRGHVELELSAKEFDLLRLLMSHPGEVLTRDHILEHVWDYTYGGGSNVVDQYVSVPALIPEGRTDIVPHSPPALNRRSILHGIRSERHTGGMRGRRGMRHQTIHPEQGGSWRYAAHRRARHLDHDHPSRRET